MPARTGKGAREKGLRFESQIIRDLWDGKTPWKPRSTPDGGKKLPVPYDVWHLEMKNKEALNIWDALHQAREDADGRPFAVIFTRAREEIYVAIEYETWRELVGKRRQ